MTARTHTDTATDAAQQAADLAVVRRVAAATDPRDYAAGLVADAFGDRPVPPEVRLAYLSGELEGALRELAAFEEARRSAGPACATGSLISRRVWRYLNGIRGEHFRARARRAAEALDAALAAMEGDGNG